MLDSGYCSRHTHHTKMITGLHLQAGFLMTGSTTIFQSSKD